MFRSLRTWVLGCCGLALLGGGTVAGAQSVEAKEKPPMYTYEASWVFPRSVWPDVEKGGDANRKTLERALASGGLIGFGNDANVLHAAEGATHDNWLSGMSIAGVLNALAEIAKADPATTSLLSGATKHWDNLYVSRHYNWHPGTWKGAYTRAAYYLLKADAPNDALETLSTSFIVPVMEKLLAEGTIVEYEIDTEAMHSEDPSGFYVIYITPTAEGLDKSAAALNEAIRKAPMTGLALGSFLDMSKHHDVLVRSTATYK